MKFNILNEDTFKKMKRENDEKSHYYKLMAKKGDQFYDGEDVFTAPKDGYYVVTLKDKKVERIDEQ